VTYSEALAQATKQEIERQISGLKRRAIIE
jgi:histidinol dehydrogenase